MTLKININDGTKTNRSAEVTDERALKNIEVPWPPLDVQKIVPFRQYMTDDGTSSGSNDMRVNGATTNVDFFIEAHEERDRYLTTLSFVIADTGNFAMNEFANSGAALGTGCRLFYNHTTVGEIDIHEALTTNFDIIRLGFGEPAFGNTSNTFRGTNFIGTAEAIMPIVDLRRIIPPFGIKLDLGSDQRLTLRVRDNLSATGTTFNVIAYGFDRLQ